MLFQLNFLQNSKKLVEFSNSTLYDKMQKGFCPFKF